MLRRILYCVGLFACVLPAGGHSQVSQDSVPKGESKPGPKPGSVPVAEDKPNPEPELGVMTVADVLLALQLDESLLQYSDEPPGKLRELHAVAPLRGSKTKVAVQIELATRGLMSTIGKWDIQTVRAAKVARVTISGK